MSKFLWPVVADSMTPCSKTNAKTSRFQVQRSPRKEPIRWFAHNQLNQPILNNVALIKRVYHPYR